MSLYEYGLDDPQTEAMRLAAIGRLAPGLPIMMRLVMAPNPPLGPETVRRRIEQRGQQLRPWHALGLSEEGDWWVDRRSWWARAFWRWHFRRQRRWMRTVGVDYAWADEQERIRRGEAPQRKEGEGP